MEINIIFRINSNSSSADRGEGTDPDTISDFTKKKNSQLASSLAVQGGWKKH